jgi:hypothetical protein
MATEDVAGMWIAVQARLGAAANISNALWGEGGRLGEQRAPLRDSLQVANSSPLKEVAMRNHFEHEASGWITGGRRSPTTTTST